MLPLAALLSSLVLLCSVGYAVAFLHSAKREADFRRRMALRDLAETAARLALLLSLLSTALWWAVAIR